MKIENVFHEGLRDPHHFLISLIENHFLFHWFDEIWFNFENWVPCSKLLSRTKQNDRMIYLLLIRKAMHEPLTKFIIIFSLWLLLLFCVLIVSFLVFFFFLCFFRLMNSFCLFCCCYCYYCCFYCKFCIEIHVVALDRYHNK